MCSLAASRFNDNEKDNLWINLINHEDLIPADIAWFSSGIQLKFFMIID